MTTDAREHSQRGRGVVRTLALVVILVALMGAGVPATRAEDPDRIEQPVWSIGDWWELTSSSDSSVVRMTVLDREGTGYVLVRTSPGVRPTTLANHTRYVADADGWVTKAIDPSGKVTESPDKYEWVKFPLTLGARWFFNRVGKNVKGGTTAYAYDCRADRWESITLGSTTTRAMKIGCQSRNRNDSSTYGHAAWYAPDAKRLVRLVSYYTGGPQLEVRAWHVTVAATPPAVAGSSPSAPPAGASPPAPAPGPTAAARPTPAASIAVELEGPAGADVRIGQGRFVLDARGHLSVKLRPGTHQLEATKSGFVTAREALTLTEGATRVQHRLAMTPVVPPAITMVEPRPDAPVRGASVRLRLRVTSAHRLAEVRVGKVGDPARQTFAPTKEGKPGEPWPVEATVALAEGDNAVQVEAIDEYGGRTEERLTIVRQSLTATPAPARPRPAPAATDTEPPRIALNHPEEGKSVETAQAVVLGLVTDNVAVDQVLVSVNGRMVTMSGEPAVNPRSRSVRASVPLQPGVNVIEIMAVDKAGNAAQLVRTITRNAPAAAAAAPPAPKSQTWAVVIGIGGYESALIPRLKYTVADAEAVYQTLIRSAGFKKDNVMLLTDRTERKPTLRNIKWALGTFLSKVARKDDTVLIFFAGHGAPDVDIRGAERDGLAKYLIPQDADPDDLFSTALPMDDLQTIFSRIESERVIAFLDACYSGAAGGRTFMSKSVRASSVDDQFLERLTRSKGRAIVTASRPSEVSIELAELGHGIFSYYLVEGLKGAADLNRDGIVSLQELYEYLEQQVSNKSRLAGANQHPVMKGEMEGVLPLAKVRRP
jgi:uncharacterized caspase-like protein